MPPDQSILRYSQCKERVSSAYYVCRGNQNLFVQHCTRKWSWTGVSDAPAELIFCYDWLRFGLVLSWEITRPSIRSYTERWFANSILSAIAVSRTIFMFSCFWPARNYVHVWDHNCTHTRRESAHTHALTQSCLQTRMSCTQKYTLQYAECRVSLPCLLGSQWVDELAAKHLSKFEVTSAGSVSRAGIVT